MARIPDLLKWHYAAIFGAVLVGTMALSLATNEKNSGVRPFYPGAREQPGHFTQAFNSWDRYRTYRVAYLRALRATSYSFDVSEFAIYGVDPHLRKKDVERGISALVNVVTTTPDEDGAWSDLAWLYAVQGENAKAIAAEQKAISLYRYDYTYYVLLGVFLERSGRSDDARSAYGRALVLYPRLTTSQFWNALQSRQPVLADKSTQSAFEVLEQEHAGADDFGPNEARARLAEENGRVKEATDIVISINTRLSNLSGMWELQGEMHEARGEPGEAILDYRRSIFLDRSDPLPRERLAELELKVSDTTDARIELLQAWKLVQFLESPGAMRRSIQYHRNNESGDGQLPKGLIDETQPSFKFQPVFTQLAILFASQGDAAHSNEMKSISDQAESKERARPN
jgi:Flp pilus assembly protein TadD